MPKSTNPAGEGGARRRSKIFGGLEELERYDDNDSTSRVAVYSGRELLGNIIEVDGTHQAFDTEGELLGVFPTRTAAALAFGHVQP